ncbi:response regulator transcription factor [Luteolibacter pohnpeiensis]|uniref:Response regulator transcription factor n=1 Tax=Luteolibacter pohnpeiensis TaxID=454153 RepID=A0A934S202_9BACT|nr:response regulator [Luteolibacter pohnpeiensis]MBK1880931.1 response regulator transcription factor [Luteolibacter pohnpeiensis]
MKTPTIGIVDDDPGIVQSLGRLLTNRGFQVHGFHSAEEFLWNHREPALDCAVFDLEMPGLGGLELQEQLRKKGNLLPVVFLSGEGDIPSTVRAMKGGAINFLTKPVDAGELLNSLRLALIQRNRERLEAHEHAEIRGRFESLTPREQEVLRHVIAGRLNKQIAAELGISEQTVKIHRMHITEKTGLPSVAELVRAASDLHIEPAHSIN